MKLKRIKGDFTVSKVKDYSEVNLNTDFCFIEKTDEENSLVCRTQDTPDHTLIRDDGWKMFRVEGTLDFSLVGILAEVSRILAENQISIFAVSTYNTDYVLVKKENNERALQILSENGYEVI